METPLSLRSTATMSVDYYGVPGPGAAPARSLSGSFFGCWLVFTGIRGGVCLLRWNDQDKVEGEVIRLIMAKKIRDERRYLKQLRKQLKHWLNFEVKKELLLLKT